MSSISKEQRIGFLFDIILLFYNIIIKIIIIGLLLLLVYMVWLDDIFENGLNNINIKLSIPRNTPLFPFLVFFLQYPLFLLIQNENIDFLLFQLGLRGLILTNRNLRRLPDCLRHLLQFILLAVNYLI